MRSAVRVIRTVREKHACTQCDAIVQAPALSRPICPGVLLQLRTTPSVYEQAVQPMEMEATGAPQKYYHKLNQKVGALPRTPTLGQIAHLVIDSTGLKAFGECKWKVKTRQRTPSHHF